MADWQEIKKNAQKISARMRAVKPANEPLLGGDHFRDLKDRLPRPTAVDIVVEPKIKRGREISGAQMGELKSGTMKIEATLDLHGLTQREAHRELDYFMAKQTARGARLLLIITGKGKDLQGVLRQQLPGWLMTGEWARHILTIHPAHRRHGGDGATYVLLRKIKQQ